VFGANKVYRRVGYFYFTGFVTRFITGNSKVSFYEDKFTPRKHAAEQPKRQFVSNIKLIVPSKDSDFRGTQDQADSINTQQIINITTWSFYSFHSKGPRVSLRNTLTHFSLAF
jgi:hypothetical protein